MPWLQPYSCIAHTVFYIYRYGSQGIIKQGAEINQKWYNTTSIPVWERVAKGHGKGVSWESRRCEVVKMLRCGSFPVLCPATTPVLRHTHTSGLAQNFRAAVVRLSRRLIGMASDGKNR